MNKLTSSKRVLILSALLVLLIAALITYSASRHTLKNIVKLQSVVIAEIVARQATTMRTVYSNRVVEKLKKDDLGGHVQYQDNQGYVPVPAQFLKYVGLATTENTAELFEYKPVSKWNLDPEQGLSDDFLLWAWPQLEAQDQTSPQGPIAWQPISRVEERAGKPVLRYLWADPATSISCVNCHNAAELTEEIKDRRSQQGIAPGKHWQQHQLLGALSITIPLDKIEQIALAQLHETIVWVIAVLAISLIIIIFFTVRNARHKNRLATLSWQASHDALTGFYNRRGLELHFEKIQDRVVRKDKQYAVCVIDLDGFKSVNDTHGHDAGDKLLRLLGERLPQRLRENDIIARTGGDEFIVILEGCPLDQAINIANKIRENICDAAVEWHDNDLRVTASIGIAMLDATSKDLEQVIKLADQACYTSKRSGKNRVSTS